jgi:hypothetical protein
LRLWIAMPKALVTSGVAWWLSIDQPTTLGGLAEHSWVPSQIKAADAISPTWSRQPPALARALEPAGAFELGERLGYLRPGRLPTGLVQAGEHLVQRAERLPLEPDTVGRRGQPQRRGHKPGDHVAEPGRRECLFEHTRAAEAERAWLAGGKRRELRAPAND